MDENKTEQNVDMENQTPAEQPQEQPAEKPQEQPAEKPQEQPAEQEAPAQEAPTRQVRQRAPGDENTIFIGRKSTMGYVLAVVTQFNSGAENVKVKARGKLISKAVDVSEITKGRFLPDMKYSNINIVTEEVQNEDGTKSKVSSIEITLTK